MKTPRSAVRFIVLVFACLGLGLLHAGDWPQWRGANRDGLSTETGLLKEWPADGPPLLWKARGFGEGYGTVAIVGRRLYLQGDKGNETHLTAFDLVDQKMVWSTPFGKSGAPGWGGFAGPRCTPTVDGNLIFAVAQFGEVACFNAENGQILWRKDYEKDFGGVRPEWGFAASPLVDGDKVLLAPGGSQGNVVALNKKNGELIWRSKAFTDEHHYASLMPVAIGGVRQYLQLTARSVAGIAAQDGSLLWRAERRGATAVIPDPVYHDGHVYVTSGYGIGCNLFKITAEGGKFSAEQVYANKVMVNHHGGVVRVGDHLYGYSEGKGWTCQNFKTGEAAWQDKTIGKGSVLYADGHLILREERKEKGLVAWVEATPTAFKLKGRFTPPDQSGKENWPHPVVLDGRLYLRDQDLLLCYDLKAR